VQNYLLVKRSDEDTKTIARLKHSIYDAQVMTKGDSMTSFAAWSLDSTRVTIEPRRGIEKKLFLVFTTTCQACLSNMPNWNHLSKDLFASDVTLIGICKDSLFKVHQFRQANEILFPVYSIVNDTIVQWKYKFQLFPQTVLTDSLGKVLKVWAGALTDSAMSAIKDSVVSREIITERR
jgi:peroxiredoxin